MNTKILALASALAAATALTSVAEAGGGTRLNFGFPMGTFVATPARGGGHAVSTSYAQQQLAKKKAAALQAARRSAASSTKVAKAVEKDETNNEADASRDPAATGSTALIETSKTTASTETAPVAKAETAAQEPASTTVAAAPASETAAAAQAVTEEKKAEEPKEETSSSKVSKLEDLACKKYIPAIGLTVSVGCKN